MLGDFSKNFFFLLVRHLGEYLQANAFFARCLTNGIARLQQGYENCWKECCSQARELLYLELLSISVSKGVSSHLLSIDSLGAEPLDIGVSPLKAGQPLEVLDVSSQTP